MSASETTVAHRAPPVGRLLRGLLGVWLLYVVSSVLFRNTGDFAMRVLGIALGLAVLYVLLAFAIRTYAAGLHPWLGAILALVPVCAVYALGGPGGRIGALAFLGPSLVLASLRGDPGCEVMSIPGALARRHTDLACLLFTPTDWLERRLRG